MGIIFISIFGRMLTPFDPLYIGTFPPSLPPSGEHLLGTDSLGRDVLAQLFLGIQLSLTVGLLVATMGTLLGATIGFMAGYYGEIVDQILRSLTDIFLVIPMLPMLILISSFSKPIGIPLMASILALFSWASPARQVRSQTLSIKKRDFIYMAKLSGMRSREIVFTEIMPHMFQWMTANFTNTVLWAVIAETALELLGLGAQHTMTLGMMLYWANSHSAMFNELWWWWGSPTVMLILIFISLYLMHVGIDELVDPRLRRGG